MNKQQKINRLEELAYIIYADEDEDSYDVPSATLYWGQLSEAELDAELADYEQRAASMA